MGIRMTKWRTLVLATVGFNVSFLVWFSFAPFTEQIGGAFGLGLAQIGLLTSAAVWITPPGRFLAGWLADRYGAPRVFAVVLSYVGIFSVWSAFITSYELFFLTRLVVGSAGVTFVVGIQHIAQWFPKEQLGTAEGIYGGIGDAGVAVGALLLPRLFANWSGPLFETGWRAAFFYSGILAVVVGVIYGQWGESAATKAKATKARKSAGLKQWLHTATRYGVVALSLGYLMSFGVTLSLNGWLPTYFQEGFGVEMVLASTFMATFSLSAGLLRPLGGWLSDVLVRRELDLLPIFRGRYREQWTVICLTAVVLSLVAFWIAGRTGSVLLTVSVGLFVGLCCGFGAGAIFAQLPATFPHRSGTAAGIVGGIGTVGGIGFPLLYSTAGAAGFIHSGYLVVALAVLPIVLFNAWLAIPRRAVRAHVDGVLSVGVEQPQSVSDDDRSTTIE